MAGKRIGSLVATALLGLSLTSCYSGTDSVSDAEFEERIHGFGFANWKFDPKTLWDLNPDPNVTEVFLFAHEKMVNIPGVGPTPMWVYNGRFPGPTIKANAGEHLIVHFLNFLPDETTIHWHGLDVPANMDGSHISQGAVPPGGYFRYEFDLINEPSTYWYHPHVQTNVATERGLQGSLVIEDEDQDEAYDLPSTEYVAVLDDILIDENGVAQEYPDDPAERATMQFNGREGNHMLVNGEELPKLYALPGQPIRLRFVNTANARFMRLSFPGDNAYRIRGDQGLLEHPDPIHPIGMVEPGGGHGGDGGHDGGHDGGMDDGMNDGGMDDGMHDGGMDDGMHDGGMHDGGMHDGGMEMVSDPDPHVGLMLTPGERAEVVFTPRGDHGDSVFVEWHDFPRGRHTVDYDDDGNLVVSHAHDDGARPPIQILEIKLVSPGWWVEPEDDYVPPDELAEVEAIDATGAAPLAIRFGHGQPNAEGNITFFSQMDAGAPVPFPIMDPDTAHDVTVGETRVWEVTNMTMGAHNFHTHGFTFQLLETEFVDDVHPENNHIMPAATVETQDTIFVPARPGAGGTTRTIVRLAAYFGDEGREGTVAASGKAPVGDESGGWLAHCHILEHSNRGMMSFFEVFYP